MFFGERIRELREENGLLQRHLAASLQMDTPMFSKIERGERKAKRQQAILLAEILKVPKEELLVLWLAGSIYELVENEDMAILAIDLVKQELKTQYKGR